MASAVGPSGHVVGMDVSDRFFGLCDGHGLELRKGDLLVDDLEPGYFDFVHCRLVLMHLSPDNRRRLLHRLWESLRPGGWLVAMDAAFSYRPVPDTQRIQALYYRLLELVVAGAAPNADFSFGPQLSPLLAECGFVSADAWGVFGLPLTAGSVHRALAINTAETTMRFAMHDTTGLMTESELREIVANIDDGTLTAVLPYVVASGQRAE